MPKDFRFDRGFRELFLDIWYSKNPGLFMTARESCDAVGNEMMIWLALKRPDFYNQIYEETLKERLEVLESIPEFREIPDQLIASRKERLERLKKEPKVKSEAWHPSELLHIR